MLTNLIDILREGIALGEAPSLKTNGFASRLTDYLIKAGSLPDSSRYLALLRRNEFALVKAPQNLSENSDLRIKRLFLKNIRQYAISPYESDFYSIGFSDDSNNPVSSIFLGANGSGKTTLYASLEYLYLGRSEIAASHGCREDDQWNFFKTLLSADDSVIDAELHGSRQPESNRISGYEYPASFCSECDYFEITRNWSDIDRYVVTQLGYGELKEVLDKLEQLEKLLQLAFEYKKVNDEIAHISQSNSGSSKPLDKISALNVRASKIQSDFKKVRGYNYVFGIRKFLLDDDNKVLDSGILNEVSATLRFLNSKWLELLDQFASVVDSVLKIMMKGYLEPRKETLKVDKNGGKLSVSLIVTSVGGDQVEVRPVEYFNTFRLKLFCVAFKLSLLCCVKIKHGVNIPFVVDDVFDSSDFCNRSNIYGFIRNLFESHRKVMGLGDDDPEEMERKALQLIFFTQDNIIGENVRAGIADFMLARSVVVDGAVKYGRLFRPSDILTVSVDGNESDVRQSVLHGEEVSVIDIEDAL